MWIWWIPSCLYFALSLVSNFDGVRLFFVGKTNLEFELILPSTWYPMACKLKIHKLHLDLIRVWIWFISIQIITEIMWDTWYNGKFRNGGIWWICNIILYYWFVIFIQRSMVLHVRTRFNDWFILLGDYCS